MFINSHHSTTPTMNTWEANALEYNFQDNGTIPVSYQNDTVHDPIVYPGIYAPSGLDIFGILAQVASRPSPVVPLGPVDSNCAILVCDIAQPDYPVVYANKACAELTGYSQKEMLGRNCRFMQAPGGRVRKSSTRSHIDKNTLKKMRRAVESNKEFVVEVTNFKKNGQEFTNVITMIPICWDSPTPRYYVGFMAEKTW
ncbi:vivid PAS protein VVD [Xylariaceae sp. AK1471]|nr:vivid PAS protein VVD [Xylariaceae sp. AK1471]